MESTSPTLYRWVPYVCITGLFGYLISIWSQPIPFFPDGVDWTQYISGAEYIWHHGSDTSYPSWRKPLYPYLLGLLAVDSYAHAARLLNVTGFVGMCVAGFWMGHHRQAPWLSVWFLSILAVHPLILDALDWINPYPLWGGALAMMFALAGTVDDDSTWKHWIALTIFTIISMLLDGRSWTMILPIMLWLGLKNWRRAVGICAVLGIAHAMENGFMHLFRIDNLSLWEMVLEQRTYLFREGMALQLFPETKGNLVVAAACIYTNPIISVGLDWGCSLQMAWTNWMAWLEWHLIPHWGVLLIGLIWGWKKIDSIDDSFGWKIGIFGSMLLGQFLLSGLVWQPPRYLFLSLWLFMTFVAWMIEELRRSQWWMILFTLPLVLGWFWQAPALESQDRPKDWNTTGRLLREQVGEMVLNCTPRPYTLSQMSPRRSTDWRMEMDPTTCASWMANGTAEGLGIDTVLSESRFMAPRGWTLETGFDFKSGVLWMYRKK